jgi:probable HAF family extracellular repeat protein
MKSLKNNQRNIMKLRLTELLVIGTILAAVPSLAQTYTLQDLGTLPGSTVSQGYALNELGQACGTSGSLATAILFSDGHVFDLGGFVSGDVTVANGINDSTVVVGYERFAAIATSHALIWSNGKIQDIHSPSLFPSGTEAMAINDSGVVIGEGWLNNYSFHIFLYENGQMVDIGPPGSFQASVGAINDAGEIIGNYYTSSTDNGYFLYSNGKFTKLAVPAGAAITADAINNAGVIVGAISFNNGAPSHAAIYTNGVWTDLGAFPGATAGTAATGINTAGQIIAVAGYRVTSYHPFIPAKTIACIVRNGGVVNLNTLIPTNSGFNLSRAIAINDAGQILCNTKTQNGVMVSNQHAVLLTPK